MHGRSGPLPVRDLRVEETAAMKHAWPLILSVILGLALPVVAQPVSTPPPVLIVPGQSIAGVALGRTAASTLNRLGAWAEQRHLRDGTLYTYPRYGLNVYISDGVVRAISSTNSLLRTAEGIAPGSTVADVRRAYGGQFTDAVIEGLMGIAFDQHGIAFGLDGVIVSVVIVYPSRTAAATPAAAPALSSPAAPSAPGTISSPAVFAPPPGLASPPSFVDVGMVALPRVEDLKPFTPETQYMSVTGFLRYVVYQQTGTWLTQTEATRMLQEQQRTRL
jgi:hypothetical protein